MLLNLDPYVTQNTEYAEISARAEHRSRTDTAYTAYAMHHTLNVSNAPGILCVYPEILSSDPSVKNVQLCYSYF
jgi:hypothetical protein